MRVMTFPDLDKTHDLFASNLLIFWRIYQQKKSLHLINKGDFTENIYVN